MSNFVLDPSCPNCGAQLERTASIDTFACAYCGRSYGADSPELVRPAPYFTKREFAAAEHNAEQRIAEVEQKVTQYAERVASSGDLSSSTRLKIAMRKAEDRIAHAREAINARDYEGVRDDVEKLEVQVLELDSLLRNE